MNKLPVLTVAGENAFQTMVSQILVAIKRDIPLPNPYPFCRSSSNSNTISPATNNWMIIRRQTPAPISVGSPYIPVMT